MEFVSHPPVTPASPWMVWTELKIGKRQLDENIIKLTLIPTLVIMRH